jgi:hypothetical protein
VARLIAEAGGPPPGHINIMPIQVVYSQQGLGIFVGRLLLEYAAVNGPFYNGPGLPGLRITDGDAFTKAVGKALVKADEDGSTLITKALDAAIIRAAEIGGEGCDVTPPIPDAQIVSERPYDGPPGGDADVSGQ